MRTITLTLVWLLACGPVAQPAGAAAAHGCAPPGGAAPPQPRRIGSIVGAEYLSHSARFVLYAEAASRNTALYEEQIAQLASALSRCSEQIGFSLEFDRQATGPFEGADIRDPAAAVARLSDADGRLADLVAETMGASWFAELRRLQVANASPGRLRKAALRTLNTLRSEPLLLQREQLAPDREAALEALPPGARRDLPRVRRVLLEDALSPMVAQQRGPRYQIRYRPSGCEAALHGALSQTLTERIFLTTDSFLKQAAYAMDLPDGLLLGAGQAELCGEELQAWIAAGNKLEDYPQDPFVVFFDLAAKPDYGGAGISVSYVDAALVVRSGGARRGQRAPRCVELFAQGLTRNLPNLLAADGALGEQFRTLEALMLIVQALQWGRRLGLSLRRDPADRIAAQTCPNQPPLLQQFPTVVGYGGQVGGIVYQGGALLPGPLLRTPAAGLPVTAQLAAPPPPAGPRAGKAAEQDHHPDLIPLDVSWVFDLTGAPQTDSSPIIARTPSRSQVLTPIKHTATSAELSDSSGAKD